MLAKAGSVYEAVDWWFVAQLVSIAVLSLITLRRKDLSSNSRHRVVKRRIQAGVENSDVVHGNPSREPESRGLSQGIVEVDDEEDGEVDGEGISALAASIATQVAAECMLYYTNNDTTNTQSGAVSTTSLPTLQNEIAPPFLSQSISIDEDVAQHHAKRIRNRRYSTDGTLIGNLSSDNIHHIVSFLTAKEVVTCMIPLNRGLEMLCGSDLAWRVIFRAHFIDVFDWDVAQAAYARSLQFCPSSPSSPTPPSYYSLRLHSSSPTTFKEFYFYFAATWLAWSIAGISSEESCLVGLQGGVYDVTSFLDEHPGSPETLLARGGQDATIFFNDVGHSTTARLTANAFRIIGPIKGVEGLSSHGNSFQLPLTAKFTSKVKSQAIKGIGGNLYSVMKGLEEGFGRKTTEIEKWAGRIWNNNDRKPDIRLYFDPICAEWVVWYFGELGESSEPTFVRGSLGV